MSNNLVWICGDNGKILRLIPPIKILAPNGGEQWQSNTSKSIEWSSYEISDVKIEFTSNGGTSWNTIISSTPSTGNYLWNVPSLNSTVCKIRISNVTDSSAFDESDNYFTIQSDGLFIVWAKTFGNIWDDEGLSITETGDHGFAITGYIRFYEIDHFQKDILLLRLDENGDSLWMKSFDFDNHDDIGRSIIETSDDAFVVAGSAWDIPRHEACYILKTDGDGNFLWDNKTGLDGDNESFYSVMENELLTYVAVGDISLGTPPIFLIKSYSSSGTDGIGWSSTDYDYGYSIIRRHGLDGYAVAGVKDAGWVLLLTKNSLRPEMYNRYSMGAAAYSIDATYDSSYIVTGYSTSQPSDILLIKYDKNGTMKWLKSFGGDSADIGYSVLETNDRGFIIAGSTESFGSGGKDVYIVRTDSLGEEIWTMTIGGTDDDEARSIKKTFDGGYIISGSTSSFGNGAKDVWVIKLSQDVVIPVSLMSLSAFVESNFYFS
ncbi:MAG: hypothetical protein IPH11_11270 [Ignavibacteriales bacterium]|nr:hypothetical protein [Ignavibacteriales bacterium]